jgi:hypothetical protein
VVDRAKIELDRLLNCTVDELTALVKPLSASNCERYARAVLGRIGGPSFEQLMIRILQTAAPKDGGHPPKDPDTYYFAVRELFPHVAEDNDVVGRVVLLTLLAGTLRLEAHRDRRRRGGDHLDTGMATSFVRRKGNVHDGL